MKRVLGKLLTTVLCVCLIVSLVAVPGLAATTTPNDVTRAQASSRLTTLVNALKGSYFTTTGKTCHTPAEGGHGCNACNLPNVVKASWLKDKVGLVPNESATNTL